MTWLTAIGQHHAMRLALARILTDPHPAAAHGRCTPRLVAEGAVEDGIHQLERVAFCTGLGEHPTQLEGRHRVPHKGLLAPLEGRRGQSPRAKDSSHGKVELASGVVGISKDLRRPWSDDAADLAGVESIDDRRRRRLDADNLTAPAQEVGRYEQVVAPTEHPQIAIHVGRTEVLDANYRTREGMEPRHGNETRP